VEAVEDADGTIRSTWDPAESVNAVAFDTPLAGWRGRHVNTLRLWSARATDPLRLEDFNRGDHVGALADRVRLEAISRVLYPSDETEAGHELRLRQEYFFASASLQDLLRRHKSQHGELASLADHVAIQLTHPAIGARGVGADGRTDAGARWDHARCSTTRTTRCRRRRWKRPVR
jgi:starch phosphorylase